MVSGAAPGGSPRGGGDGGGARSGGPRSSNTRFLPRRGRTSYTAPGLTERVPPRAAAAAGARAQNRRLETREVRGRGVTGVRRASGLPSGRPARGTTSTTRDQVQVIERIRAGDGLLPTNGRTETTRGGATGPRETPRPRKTSALFTSNREIAPSRSDVPSSSEGASNARSRVASSRLDRAAARGGAHSAGSQSAAPRRLCRSPERGARGPSRAGRSRVRDRRLSFVRPSRPTPARVPPPAERVHPPPSQKVTHPLSVNTPRRRRLLHPSSFS